MQKFAVKYCNPRRLHISARESGTAEPQYCRQLMLYYNWVR